MKQKSLVWPVPTMKNVETILQFPRWGNVPIAEGLIDLWITEQARREWSPTRKRDVTVVGHVSLKKGSICSTFHIIVQRNALPRGAGRPAFGTWKRNKTTSLMLAFFPPTLHVRRKTSDVLHGWLGSYMHGSSVKKETEVSDLYRLRLRCCDGGGGAGPVQLRNPKC